MVVIRVSYTYNLAGSGQKTEKGAEEGRAREVFLLDYLLYEIADFLSLIVKDRRQLLCEPMRQGPTPPLKPILEELKKQKPLHIA